MKVLLVGVEVRFSDKRAGLGEAINKHILVKVQTSQLEARCKEEDERKDGHSLPTHHTPWEHRAGRCNHHQYVEEVRRIRQTPVVHPFDSGRVCSQHGVCF